MNLEDLIPQKNDHSIFMGQTESGKTTLAEFVIRNYARKYNIPDIVVLDMKGKIAWRGFHRITRFANLIKTQHRKIIYYPNVQEYHDKDIWENFFRWIFFRENTILYVDEVSAVTKKQVMPPSYLHCMARGRELNIACFNSTQRPKDIPPSIISESKNKYVFYLQLEGDRKRASEFTGIRSHAIGGLRNHRFYYANLSVNSPFGPLYLDLSSLPDPEDEKSSSSSSSPPSQQPAITEEPAEQPAKTVPPKRETGLRSFLRSSRSAADLLLGK